MKIPVSIILVLLLVSTASASTYLVGTGIADITGPAAQANMMGMAQISQVTAGIQLRLFARAFVFADLSDAVQPNSARAVNATRLAFVSVDIALMPGGITRAVVERLQAHYGSADVYSYQNIMLSATHTHSGPGGYSTEALYDLTSFGFLERNFEAIADGIASAIIQADERRAPGRAFMRNGQLYKSNINRSAYSYPFNANASDYEYDVDKNTTLIRLQHENGDDVGMVQWFSVHGTSMNNTNSLISGDNKGFASWVLERMHNPPSAMPGTGKFVAAFAQSNEGDVSPNTMGAQCPNGTACDNHHSTCGGRVQGCIAPGPGKDMMESCKIIGMNQVTAALRDYKDAKTELSGPLQYVHSFLNFESIQVAPEFSSTGKPETTCTAALGDSFLAGTTDGPGAFNFVQGTTTADPNRKWNALFHLLKRPTLAQTRCHHPKPIALLIGDIDLLGGSPWAATVIPLQIFRIGQLVLVGVPGEFTTMSGRRLRDQVHRTLVQKGVADEDTRVVIAGLSNEYIHYCATPEEYAIQRYEAASTLFGPQQLPAFLQEFTKLSEALATGSVVDSLPPPTAFFNRTLVKPWSHDTRPEGIAFGTPLSAENQPLGNQTLSVAAGAQLQVLFQGANPRNNYRIGSSFFTVSRQTTGGGWEPVLYDSDFDLWFVWKRSAPESHTSTVRLHWQVPASISGLYRIQYSGDSKSEAGVVSPFLGEVLVEVQVPSALHARQRSGAAAAADTAASLHPTHAMLSELERWYRALGIDINERD